jgi:hypothetical protein
MLAARAVRRQRSRRRQAGKNLDAFIFGAARMSGAACGDGAQKPVPDFVSRVRATLAIDMLLPSGARCRRLALELE